MAVIPYGTSIEAIAYFADRLYTDAWDTALPADQTKALAQSTTIINRLNYKGEKNDSAQPNQFPRGSDIVTPDDIKNASFEIALALLDGVDPELEYQNLNMVAQGIASVRSTYDRTFLAPNVLAGVPSVAAWRFLAPYIRDVRNLKVSRA